MDAFDADVLIYAAAPANALGQPVRSLFRSATVAGNGGMVGIGSVLLIPELLTAPIRSGRDDELASLGALLARLDLRPADETIADSASGLGARYGLRAADAIHLATAVNAGADRFITNNSRDFTKSISEIDITYPADL